MKIEIINTTPHSIDIYKGDEVVRTIPPVGWTIRLSESVTEVGEIDGIPETETVYGSADLPEEQHGVIYIVSALVKSAYPSRKDLRVPARAVRDENNRIIGCRSLGR